MIHVVSQQITPRLKYVVEAIDRRSNFDWELISEVSGEKIVVQYGATENSDYFSLKSGACGLLWTAERPSGKSTHDNGRVYIDDEVLDPFEQIFWALSRYEEYNFTSNDPHGRFSVENTCIPKEKLEQPWVEQLIVAIESDICKFYDIEERNKDRSLQIIPTFDIDHAFAFRNKSLLLKTGGFFKDAQQQDKERFRSRMSTLFMKGDDPYDTHQEIFKLLEHRKSYVFFHLGDRSTYDRSIHWKRKAFQQLIRSYAGKTKVGIHPSYRSNNKEDLLKKEAERLTYITGQEVYCSRQHYLMLSFPATYNALLNAGIREDHTMVFHDYPGLRAGTAYPFPYFSFDANAETGLTIFPVVYMDGTLAEYLDWDISTSCNTIQKIYNNCKPTGGHFECIWHNESIANFGRWKGWRKVLDFTLNL